MRSVGSAKTSSFGRLGTTDGFGRRVRLFPMAVSPRAFWNRWRSRVQWILICFYLMVPWIKVKGHPLLLIDIENRRFCVLGQLFFAHEVPNLLFIVLAFLMTIALLTTLLGRAWCGWACPQTVFIERLFRAVERKVEGDHLAQRRLHESAWDLNKIFLKSMKWMIFTGIAVVLAHSFLGYFVGGREAFLMMTKSPVEHPTAFFWAVFMVGLVLFDFGWFREQFCLIACPYGRFQSTMMDEGSLFLTYQASRGDCIDCLKCVKVCPTGIDIREGLQIECIACALCADTCDDVMERIRKPKGLIGYGSLNRLVGKVTPWIRGRTVLYGTLLVLSLVGLGWNLSQRKILQSEMTRAVDTPYQLLEYEGEQWAINHFKVRFFNLDWWSHRPHLILVNGKGVARAELIQGGEVLGPVEPGYKKEKQFFIKFPIREYELLRNQGLMPVVKIQTQWSQLDADLEPATHEMEVRLVGPGL